MNSITYQCKSCHLSHIGINYEDIENENKKSNCKINSYVYKKCAKCRNHYANFTRHENVFARKEACHFILIYENEIKRSIKSKVGSL